MLNCHGGRDHFFARPDSNRLAYVSRTLPELLLPDYNFDFVNAIFDDHA